MGARIAYWAALAGLAALTFAAPGIAGTELDAASMRQLAFDQLQAGQWQAALDLSNALLARDGRDAAALVIRAQARRSLGQFPEAEADARAGFAAASSGDLRYGAALVMSQILSLEDHRTMAQVWLRRAHYYATTDAQRAEVAQDYAYVREQNPLRLDFTTSLQPSNNVNNGAMRSVWDVFGHPFEISGDGQALAGVVASLGASGSYRLAQSVASYDALTFDVSSESVFLSPGARVQAPDAKNGDYALMSLSGGYQHRALLGPGGAILTSNFELGHTWYGGAPLSNSASLGLDLSQPLSPTQQGFAHLGLQRNQRLDDAVTSSTVLDLTGGMALALPNRDTLRLSVDAARTLSDAPTTDNTSLSARLDWTHAEPVNGIRWSGSLQLGKSSYDGYADLLVFGHARHDTRVTGSVSAEFVTVSTFGFSPVVTLNLGRNSSNFGLYDTSTTGIGLSFQSRF